MGGSTGPKKKIHTYISLKKAIELPMKAYLVSLSGTDVNILNYAFSFSLITSGHIYVSSLLLFNKLSGVTSNKQPKKFTFL